MSSDAQTPSNPLDEAVLEKLRRLSPTAIADFKAFQATRDGDALERLILAVLADRAPDRSVVGTEWRGELSLIEDLGFDSLPIAESVFYIEDLFTISISNHDIIKIRTLNDLRNFLMLRASAA